MDRFPRCLAFTLRPENDGQDFHITPGDHGGATKLGVTIGAFAADRAAHGIKVTADQDLRDAPAAVLADLTRRTYWQAVQADFLPTGPDLLVYECGFGSGPGTAIRLLQQVLGVSVDGHLGKVTLAAVGAQPGLIEAFAARNAGFYQSLNQPAFIRGWLRRLQDRLVLARRDAGLVPSNVALIEAKPTARVVQAVDEVAITAALNANSYWQHAL